MLGKQNSEVWRIECRGREDEGAYLWCRSVIPRKLSSDSVQNVDLHVTMLEMDKMNWYQKS